MIETVTPEALFDILKDDQEIALIDVREQGVYAKAHLLLGSCTPLSCMELVIDDLVPRKNTRMVLVDRPIRTDPQKQQRIGLWISATPTYRSWTAESKGGVKPDLYCSPVSTCSAKSLESLWKRHMTPLEFLPKSSMKK